jgi:putative ABC transport system permease protein
MKYWPLVWSSLRRKPVESILIWLAVTTSFTLFGLMLGLHATYDHVIASSRMDRLDVNARFPNSNPNGVLLPMAVGDQIARVAGVSSVSGYYWLWGYYQDVHRRARVIAVDKNMRTAWSELPVTNAQWNQLFATRAGILVSEGPARRLGLKEGDTLPLITPPGTRADGAAAWEFLVLGVVPDDPRTGAYILGNLSYVDESRPPADQGHVMGFRVATRKAAEASDVSLSIDRMLANSSTPTITIPDKSNTENAVNSAISVSSRTWPIAGAGLFMILLLTANGIAQSVRERSTEFAVLETIGYRHRSLMALVFAEVAIPCAAAALVGTELANVLSKFPRQYLPADLLDMPPPTLSAIVLVWSLGCALLLSLASAAIPMRRLRYLSISEALSGR